MAITVHLQTTERRVSLTVESSILVIEFKRTIAPLVGSGPETHRLVFRGRELEDNETLSEYGNM